jgi:DNA-binding FrmR family transcriptional regulator
MNLTDPQSKQALITRLKRIEGQVRGVQTMLDQERDCTEILQQLAAIQSAVRSASMLFVEEYATRCILSPDADNPQKREELLKNLLTLLGKTTL